MTTAVAKTVGESLAQMAHAKSEHDAAQAEAKAYELAEPMVGKPTKELYEALREAELEMGNAQKSAKNKFDNYEYATLEDFLDAVRGPCLNRGLVIYCRAISDPVYSERRTQRGHQEVVARVLVEARVIHGESMGWLAVQVWGEGQDRGDKAVYKALTGARKYALAMLFGIHTTDDPEHDERQPEGNRPYQEQRQQAAPRTPSRPADAAGPAPENRAPMTDADLAKFLGWIKTIDSTETEPAPERIRASIKRAGANPQLAGNFAHLNAVLMALMQRADEILHAGQMSQEQGTALFELANEVLDEHRPAEPPTTNDGETVHE